MKNYELYEVGDKVFIKVEVTGVKVKDGLITYYLKNPQTGKPFDFMFNENQVYAIGDKE